MTRNRIIYILLLMISFGVFVATNIRAMLITLIILVSGAVVSFLFMFISGRRGVIDINFPEAGNLSRKTPMKIKFSFPGFLPSGMLRIRIVTRNRLYNNEEKLEVWLKPSRKKICEYDYPWNNKDCGSFNIRFEKADVFDLLGLWRTSIKVPSTVRYQSFPAIPSLDVFLSGENGLNQEGSTYDTTRSGNDVTEVFEIRDYHEGDSIKSIHWKLSEKVDKPMVREYSRPVDDYTMIFCDCSFSGFANNHILVNNILGITAAMSQSLILQGFSHRLSALSGDDFLDISVEYVNDTFQALSEFLHVQLADNSDLYGHLKLENLPAKLIFVTAFFEEKLIAELAARTDLTVVLISLEGKEYVELRNNYRIIVIPEDSMMERLHRLEI